MIVVNRFAAAVPLPLFPFAAAVHIGDGYRSFFASEESDEGAYVQSTTEFGSF